MIQKNVRIVIDARMYQESGIGRYIRNLIQYLQNIDKVNEYFIIHTKDQYDRLVYHTNFHKILGNFKWYGVSEQIKLLKILNGLRPDLVHFPHFNIPIFYNGKFIVTIHDLIHQHFGMERATTHGPLVYKFKQLGYKRVFQHAIKKSLKIFVPSNFVKNQLINECGVDSRKIIITPEAVDDKILSIDNKMKREEIDIVMKKFNLKSPYIFYVGNAHPHKNIKGLIKAFLNLRKNYRVSKTYKDLSLVLSGYDHYFWQILKNEHHNYGIIYTGYVNDEGLVALYKNALCFVMPSYEEGFGIPLLEAMASSCPVVSSNAGSLPEVGGDACVYFDPYNIGDMGDKIDKVLKSKNLRQAIIVKGLKRYKQFSWRRLARETLEVYSQCV